METLISNIYKIKKSLETQQILGWLKLISLVKFLCLNIPNTSRSNEQGYNTSIETFKQVENIVLEQVLNKFELLMTTHNFSFPFKHTTFNQQQQSIVKTNLNHENIMRAVKSFYFSQVPLILK